MDGGENPHAKTEARDRALANLYIGIYVGNSLVLKEMNDFHANLASFWSAAISMNSGPAGKEKREIRISRGLVLFYPALLAYDAKEQAPRPFWT